MALCEIKRITQSVDIILRDLSKSIGLKTCNKPFEEIIKQSINQTWARDPFDRIIVAQASIN